MTIGVTGLTGPSFFEPTTVLFSRVGPLMVFRVGEAKILPLFGKKILPLFGNRTEVDSKLSLTIWWAVPYLVMVDEFVVLLCWYKKSRKR